MTSTSNFDFVNSGKPQDHADRVLKNASECQRAWNQAVSSGKYPATTPAFKVEEESNKDFPYGCQYSKVKPDSDPSQPETMKLRFKTMKTNRPCSDFSQCILFKRL